MKLFLNGGNQGNSHACAIADSAACHHHNPQDQGVLQRKFLSLLHAFHASQSKKNTSNKGQQHNKGTYSLLDEP